MVSWGKSYLYRPLLSRTAISSSEGNIYLVVAPDEKLCWRNAVLAFEFAGKVGDLLKTQLISDGFDQTDFPQHSAGSNQP